MKRSAFCLAGTVWREQLELLTCKSRGLKIRGNILDRAELINVRARDKLVEETFDLRCQTVNHESISNVVQRYYQWFWRG